MNEFKSIKSLTEAITAIKFFWTRGKNDEILMANGRKTVGENNRARRRGKRTAAPLN